MRQVAGGALADFFGKQRMMTIYLLCMIVLVTIMTVAKGWWGAPFVISVFIGTYYTLYVFLTVAIFATGMELCWNRVAATQFTLYMAIANLGRATGSSFLGPLRSTLPWEYVILSIAGFALAMLILVQMLRMKTHLDRIDGLEKHHLELEAARAARAPARCRPIGRWHARARIRSGAFASCTPLPSDEKEAAGRDREVNREQAGHPDGRLGQHSRQATSDTDTDADERHNRAKVIGGSAVAEQKPANHQVRHSKQGHHDIESPA